MQIDFSALNSLLATEWGLIRALRVLEAETEDESKRQVLKRLRTDSVANVANMARLVREAGGHPTDVPSDLGEQLKRMATFEEKVAQFRGAQLAQRDALDATTKMQTQPAARVALETMVALHTENIAWLQAVIKE